MTENVEEAAERLRGQWLEVPRGCTLEATVATHRATLDLAERHPESDSAAVPLEVAAQVYAGIGAFQAATVMAARAVEIRRDLCLDTATPDRLGRHVYALDLLASIFRARGMEDAVTACLVQLVELHFACSNTAGVAWAVRELGARALLANDLDNAIAKLTRADELYGDDPELAEERAECRVLLGRARLAQGDQGAALRWFEQATDDFTAAGADAPAEEAEALQDAVRSSSEPPAPELLRIGDFGVTAW